jgi:hypothetical protein
VCQKRHERLEKACSDTFLAVIRLTATIESIESATQRGAHREALLLMTPQPAPDNASIEEPKPIDFLAMYLESLRQELDAICHNHRELAALCAEEEKVVHALAEQDRRARHEQAAIKATDESLRSEMARTRQLFDSVVKRLQEINTAADHEGRSMHVLSSVGPAGQVAPNFSRIVTPASILGLLLGFGLATLVNLADKRVCSPADNGRQLRLSHSSTGAGYTHPATRLIIEAAAEEATAGRRPTPQLSLPHS